MRVLIILVVLLVCFNCYADRVCLEKATGKLIQHLSGDVNDPIDVSKIPKDQQAKYIADIKKNRLESMIRNAVAEGYDINDIEAKEVTKAEWKVIEKKWITDPAKEKDKEKKAKKEKARKDLKASGLTEQQLKDLEEMFD